MRIAAALLLVLAVIYENVYLRRTCTKRYNQSPTRLSNRERCSCLHVDILPQPCAVARDVYYRDPQLFRDQSAVDRIVDRVAHLFNVPRHALNIVAAAKGLVYGAVCVRCITERGTEHFDLATPTQTGHLIAATWFRHPLGTQLGAHRMWSLFAPTQRHGHGHVCCAPGGDAVLDIHSGVRCILVVEKEAVFHTLLTGAVRHLPEVVLITVSWGSAENASIEHTIRPTQPPASLFTGVAIFAQGRGYADLATRLLVAALHRTKPHLPVVFLCDYDPHGINIMLHYIYGGQLGIVPAELVCNRAFCNCGSVQRALD